jgi:Mg-chelatase subunit ChlD
MLFAFFGLWTTTLLAGGVAVSIPVIIHLLNRRRYKIVTWAAMRFLLNAQRQNTRRMRIEQLLLLLCRMGLVALIVMAMAAVMPWAEPLWAWLPGGKDPTTNTDKRMHHIFVIDASMSMNLRDGNATAFDRARQQVIDQVEHVQAGDGFSVLLLKDNPTWLIGKPSQDGAKVKQELQTARAGHGNASVPAALNMIIAKLSEASARFPAQAVYFITDMQRSTWQATLPSTAEGEETKRDPTEIIRDRALVAFVDVGKEDAGNLAVTDLSFSEPFVTTGTDVVVNASVQNFGVETRKDIHVELLVGKAREHTNDPALAMHLVAEQVLPVIKANDQLPVQMKYRFPTAGTYAVQVKLQHPDQLEADDARTVVVTVKDTIPVILVNGKLAPDRFETATGYLRLALNPFPPGSEPKYAPLRPRVINQQQFAFLTDDELKDVDCIYWCDVPQFGGADLRRMETHVRRGGGLVFSMGDKAAENFDAYNRLLYKDGHGLLPAKLSKKIQTPQDEHFFLRAEDEVKSFLELPLRAFKDEKDKTTLNHVRFYQYVQAAPAPQAHLILKYWTETGSGDRPVKGETTPPGDPAMLEWNPPAGRDPGEAPRSGKRVAAPAHHRGKVVLVTSALNTDWSNWPGSPSYGAMVQELTRLAASGRLREQAAVVGTVLEEYLSGATAELEVVFHYPEAFNDIKPSKSRTQLVEDVNVFRFGDTDQTRTDYSGIYRVIVSATGQEIPFAVNVPVASTDQRGSESDLARLTVDGLKKAYPAWENLRSATDIRNIGLAGGPEQVHTITEITPRGPEMAGYFLGLVLLLLFIEVIMAWKFGHYTTVEGVTAPTTASLFWPVTLAIIALVVFTVLATAFYVAIQNRDVLALVPRMLFREELRGWIEGLMGKPPTPPGESAHWEPNFNSWLPGFLPGSQYWWAIGVLIGGGAMIALTYLAEAPAVARPYKLILAGLRICMLILTVWLLLPQFSVSFTQEVWPDVAIIIDTSRSMGEPDAFQDKKVFDRSTLLSDLVRKQVEASLPEKLKQLQAELESAAKKKAQDPSNNAYRDEVDYLEGKIRYWEKQKEIITSPKWRPTRLHLVQALFAQPENDWLSYLLNERKMRIHLFQLDVNGRAIKLSDPEGPVGEITDPDQPAQVKRARDAIAHLEADGKESRLGTALQQVIDQYRGSSLAGVIMITDGVTTRDRTIGETASDYAAQKGVPVFLIGIGDDAELHDLKLEGLQCDDVVFKGDRVIFDARLTGQGYKDVTVPVVLKQKGKDGKEKEVDRVTVKVDPNSKAVKISLKHTPTEVGRKTYIVEVEPPKIEGNEKPMPPGNLRLERTIEVVEDKEIKVLYVEQQPRYEFRYVKFLLERESPNEKNKKKSITLNVVLLDAEDGFAEQDKTALADFPATLDELNKYDVVIFGDCDPNHRKLGTQRLKNLANFVRGEDEKGKKLPKAGGGFLMIAGTGFSPHAYKNTPLADIMPVEPLTDRAPQEPDRRVDKLRLELTPSGRFHPMFKFSQNEQDNERIWQKLAPMYWSSSQYRTRPLAEVLAVHPHQKAEGPVGANQSGKLPLVAQQYVGTGRSMFFGFDETWRWRQREDESRFNTFWIQVMRYLSRGRSNRTDLRLDKQVPYHLGELVKVIVTFPDGAAGPDGARLNDKTEVKVLVEYRPPGSEKDADAEVQTITLSKVPGSWGTYDAALTRTREGKYRMRLLSPDVRKTQPDGEQPSAEGVVELPPGELDRLRMNAVEMRQAADVSQGRFYTLATADNVLTDIPPGIRQSFSTTQPPFVAWNHAMVFSLVMLLLTAEWFLRKRKHLL